MSFTFSVGSFHVCVVRRISFQILDMIFAQYFCICSRHPEVKWAERLDKVYITVLLPDAKNAKVDLDPEGIFTFNATAGAADHPYELKLDLFDKVNVEVRVVP